MPRIIAIIQARMGSARLPGKVLLDILGKPMLQRVLERTMRARTLDEVVVATTREPEDEQIADLCTSLGLVCARGSQHDVLDRLYQASRASRADIVVRITADCPLIDPALIDRTVDLIGGQADFTCNRLPPPFARTLPIGLDVEACTFAALETAWKNATEQFQREHVMPYLYEGTELASGDAAHRDGPWWVARGVSPRGFKIAQLHHHPDYGSLRWTVDTSDDLELIREIFARLRNRPEFGWYEVLELVQNEPSLTGINAGVRHRSMNDVDERGP
jgi:spore coat polysaccharide biosynthesis protein SpsF